MINEFTRSNFDYNKIILSNRFNGVVVFREFIGDVNITSGRLVIKDPCHDNVTALYKKVPKGKYPLFLFYEQNQIFLSLLKFSDKKAVKFEYAHRVNESVQDTRYTELMVDMGLATYMDSEANKEFIAFIKQQEKNNPKFNLWSDLIEEHFKDENYGNLILPVSASNNNILIFHTGGDGIYPVYWGLDKDDRIVNLLVDFRNKD